jgi:hypothetical protein
VVLLRFAIEPNHQAVTAPKLNVMESANRVLDLDRRLNFQAAADGMPIRARGRKVLRGDKKEDR